MRCNLFIVKWNLDLPRWPIGVTKIHGLMIVRNQICDSQRGKNRLLSFNIANYSSICCLQFELIWRRPTFWVYDKIYFFNLLTPDALRLLLIPPLSTLSKFKCPEPTALYGFVVVIHSDGINSIPTI